MATVIVDKLKQVADPNHPNARPSLGPAVNLNPPLLAPLRRGVRVYLLESQLVDGVTWWKAVDREYSFSCCRPFYWIPSTVDGAASLEPLALECPDAAKQLSAAEIASLGGREALTCFGASDIRVVGVSRCGQAVADSWAFLLSPWETDPEDPFICDLDDTAYSVRGDVLEPWIDLADGREAVVTGHFGDPRSVSCRWIPGNFGNIVPPEGGPTETAEMLCRLQFVVTNVELR